MANAIAKLIFITLMLASLFASAAYGQEGYEHVAIFVTGALDGRTFSAPFGPNPIPSELAAKRTIEPGVELVLHPGSRFSTGVGFSLLDFPEKSFHVPLLKDQFTYTGPDGKPATISMPGTEFAGINISNAAKVKAWSQLSTSISSGKETCGPSSAAEEA